MWFIVTKVIQGELGIYMARLKRLATVYVIMAVFALLLLVFLLVALFIVAASYWGGLATALIMAGLCLVVLLALWISTIAIRRTPAKRADDRLSRDIASIAGVSALSNAPAILKAIRQRKSLLLIPTAGALGFGIWRAILAARGRW